MLLSPGKVISLNSTLGLLQVASRSTEMASLSNWIYVKSATPGYKEYHAFWSAKLYNSGEPHFQKRRCLIDGNWIPYTSITEVLYDPDGTIDNAVIIDYINASFVDDLKYMGTTKQLQYYMEKICSR